MCIVDVKVDEQELRNMRPELDNLVAIRLWVQQLVDLQMQQMRLGREGNVYSSEAKQEDLWHAIEQEPELMLNPSEIVVNDGDAIDLETFRADLHRMVDKIYAEA